MMTNYPDGDTNFGGNGSHDLHTQTRQSLRVAVSTCWQEVAMTLYPLRKARIDISFIHLTIYHLRTSEATGKSYVCLYMVWSLLLHHPVFHPL